jgi:hypothetical protein
LGGKSYAKVRQDRVKLSFNSIRNAGFFRDGLAASGCYQDLPNVASDSADPFARFQPQLTGLGGLVPSGKLERFLYL